MAKPRHRVNCRCFHNHRISAIDTNGFQEKRGLATIGIFVLSAFLTPSDPGSMLLMAVPLILLYELGIFFAYLLERPRGYS